MSVIANILNMQHRLERVLLWTMFTVCLSLGGLYVYFLSASVMHVVMTKETEESIHDMHSQIAALEAAYMERQHSISKEMVEQNGFIASGQKIFIDRADNSVVTRR